MKVFYNDIIKFENGETLIKENVLTCKKICDNMNGLLYCWLNEYEYKIIETCKLKYIIN